MQLKSKYLFRFAVMTALMCLSLGAQAQNRIYGETRNMHRRSSTHISYSGLRTEQYEGVHHLFGVYADLGYSAMITNSVQATTAPGGYATGLGFTYSYLNGRFLLQWGIGATWQEAMNRVNDVTTHTDVYVNQSPYPTVNLDLKTQYKNRMDVSRNVYLQMPVMLGYSMQGIYVLVGPKLQYNLWGDTQVRNLLVTTTGAVKSGDYELVAKELSNIPQHGLRNDVPMAKSQHTGKKLAFANNGLDVMLSAELGYEMAFSDKGYSYSRNSSDTRLRVAAYCDFGLMNIHPTTTAENLVDIPAGNGSWANIEGYSYNHVFSTADDNGRTLHNLFAGIRVTYFFYGIQTSKKCLLCGSRGRVADFW